MSVTIRDVARHAGVSISTVSRVLNGTCRVSEEKRQRVEEAAKLLGYTPNPAARTLLKQETGGLGVLLPFVNGEFFAELLIGVDAATQKNGYFLLISSSHRSEKEFMAALRGLDKRVDGLVIMATEMDAESLRESLPAQTPVVFVNTRVKGDHFDVINFDNYQGVFQGTTHLLQLGHRHIAFIKGPEKANDARERLNGYRSALQVYGLRPDEAMEISGDFSQEAGYEAVSEILNLSPRPTAIVAANDYAAMGALRALQEKGVRVPEEMAVVGFDDVPSTRYATPPLTTVRVPVREMGVLAIERLVRRIKGGDKVTPTQVRLPIELVVRNSTAPPPDARLSQ